MATAQSISRQEWEARSIVLAEEAHLTGRGRYLAQGVHGEALWQLPSQSHDGCYVVQVFPLTQRVLCSCTAGSYGRPCCHAGAALLAEQQRQAAMPETGPTEAMRWFCNGREW